MNGVGFEILARTPVPKLPLSYPRGFHSDSVFFRKPSFVIQVTSSVAMSHVSVNQYISGGKVATTSVSSRLSNKFCGSFRVEGIIFQSSFAHNHEDVQNNNYYICMSLRKHAYSNILKILPPKNENFQIKCFYFFSYFCSKHRLWVLVRTASPRRGGSNEYPQSMF